MRGGQFKDRTFDTVYIGGGTPSVLGRDIKRLLKDVRENFNVLPDAEITAEVNPESAAEFIPAAAESGVNRISVGVQSGNNAMLETLGRRHTVSDVLNTVSLIRKCGIKNMSLDLMIALPGSRLDTLAADIDFVLSLQPEHISAYILKKEPRTRLFFEDIPLPDDDAAADQYLYTCERLEGAGYTHYEVSNFAKPGFCSRHNLKYWQGGEYLGLGPAAHSYINGKRSYYKRDMKAFLNLEPPVEDGDGGSRAERIMLGLRLKEGVDLKAVYGTVPETVLKKLDPLKRAGYIISNGTSVRLTDKGMLLSNSIITELTV